MSRQQESRILARTRVAKRVELMLEIVNDRDPETLERLRLDALAEMKRWKSISLKTLATAPTSQCGIAAVYLPDEVPPAIGIFASLSRRRASFSALHEFGHHLQTFTELVDELGEQPDHGRVLEEMTSDAFAAAVLIPRKAIDAHFGAAGTPSAIQIVALYEDLKTASRAAICVAAVQRLESPGHVILIDDYGAVDFAASHLEPRLSRGIQSDAEILKAWATSNRRSVETKTRFTYRNGIQGQELYAQATAIDGYTVVVAVVDNAPWERLALSSTADKLVARWHTCERCDYLFQVWARCEVCRQPRCPECDWCDCRALLREKTCAACGLRKSIHLFPAGKDICVDC